MNKEVIWAVLLIAHILIAVEHYLDVIGIPKGIILIYFLGVPIVIMIYKVTVWMREGSNSDQTRNSKG